MSTYVIECEHTTATLRGHGRPDCAGQDHGVCSCVVRRLEEMRAAEVQLAAARAEAARYRAGLEAVAAIHDNVWNDDGVCCWCGIGISDDEHGAECPYPIARRALGPGGENDGPSK